MKIRKLLFLIIALLLFIPNTVNAVEVDTASEFVDALGGKDYAVLSADNSKITLQQDITLSETLKIIGGEYILDLNGKKISDTNNFKGNGYGLIYMNSAKLTVDDSVGNGGLYVNNGDDMPIFAQNGSELTINQANIEANWTVLNIMHSQATINNGNFTSKKRDVLYSYSSNILINNGNFSGHENCLLIMDSDITIKNGKFTAYGEENATALSIGVGENYVGKAEIWDGLFEANYIGFSASLSENYDVKIYGGTFTGLNTESIDYNNSEFVSAGISMNLPDGLNSSDDVLCLLEDGYTYFPTEIKKYELWGDRGYYFISATSNSVKVVSKDALVHVLYNLTNMTSKGLTLILPNTEYKTTIIASEGYKLPDMVYILINGGSELSTSSYSYDKTTGELIIPAERVTGNITIVGEATPIISDVKYKVIFDANKGIFKGNKTIFTIDEWEVGDEETLEKPERDGYEFIGFFTEKTGGTSLERYIAEAGIDEDLTFYAQWKIKEDNNNTNTNNGTSNNNTSIGSNPQTSDNIMTFIAILGISIIGIIATTIVRKKSKNN